jgi:hypothetical protein
MVKIKRTKKKKRRSTKHTGTTLKIWGELMCSGRVSNPCSTSDARRVNLVTDPVISHERGYDREVFTTNVKMILKTFYVSRF